jgi:UDPglucose 6-dehydrogenase
MDSRIGSKYLKGAISYGGPCFPRDNLALVSRARRVEAPADIAQATDYFNRAQIRWLANLVQMCLSDCGSAGILGLTYKPFTDVMEQSPGWMLAQELTSRGVSVAAFDPAAVHTSNGALGSTVEFARTAMECVAKADVVVLATPWPEFARIENSCWARFPGPRTVIDCWRQLELLEKVEGVNYIRLGSSSMLGGLARARESASTSEPAEAAPIQMAEEGGAA